MSRTHDRMGHKLWQRSADVEEALKNSNPKPLNLRDLFDVRGPKTEAVVHTETPYERSKYGVWPE